MTTYGRAGLMKHYPKQTPNNFRFSLNSYDTVIPAFNLNSSPIIHHTKTCFRSDV